MPTLPSEPLHILLDVAVALGLGLLIGLERERTQAHGAGLRTFALVSLSGAVCGLLVPLAGLAVLPGAFIALGLVVLANGLARRTRVRAPSRAAPAPVPDAGDEDGGAEEPPRAVAVDAAITTEIALLLVFALGCYTTLGDARLVATSIGVVTAVLLHFRPELHGLARRIGARDMTAFLQLVVAAVLVYPHLPTEPVDPLGAVNLREVWLMAILVSGLSLVGYVLFRMVGDRFGALISGAIGGMVSSTAMTASLARRAAGEASGLRMLAIGVALASSVVYLRVLVEMGVTAPALLARAAVPFSILFVLSLALCVVGLFRGGERRGQGEDSESLGRPLASRNPAEIRPALIFAALYALIRLATVWADDVLPDHWMYGVAVVAGLTDVDAITLSVANLVTQERLAVDTAWRVVLVGVLANLLFKFGIAAVLGRGRLVRDLAWLFGIPFVVALPLMLLF